MSEKPEIILTCALTVQLEQQGDLINTPSHTHIYDDKLFKKEN